MIYQLFGIARNLGIDAVVRDSKWRRRRLLVLCWHGISLDDEHLWRPGLYISPELFRERIRMLAEGGYTVLPLSEALTRLWSADLPPRSVAITFDDGCYSVASIAAPVLEQYGFPATVYLTTYYVDYQRPIFDQIVSYLLWKYSRSRLRVRAGIPVSSEEEANIAAHRIVSRADEDRATGPQKDEITRSLSEDLGVDYDDVLKRRILYLMTAHEVRRLAETGKITFDAHTHRHRTPEDLGLMARELQDNSARIAEITGRRPVHFCYPSGVTRRRYLPLLEQNGFVSATTCQPNLASIQDDRYLVPRFVDHAGITKEQYGAWLSGMYGLGRKPIAKFTTP
jgi:peptidoglycan/xylan/chitin deacetylase (PgdA/CDA1 family)